MVLIAFSATDCHNDGNNSVLNQPETKGPHRSSNPLSSRNQSSSFHIRDVCWLAFVNLTRTSPMGRGSPSGGISSTRLASVWEVMDVGGTP